MRLKGLSLFGFKSFAERQEFTFPDGITCIVGPNGCGKSNVVDAVKWVLGEQRAKALRGAEMADVIFSGTATRKPLGMAEVSLVFDNSDGVLDVDFTEVEVSRRLYRDGTSEYLLNRNKCRLRDLRELLMDTGSGPGALTFMEQGKIDQILREGTQERRTVFEEAAGVSKYKARRKETLRRLGRVEGDLLRVSDVVAEKQRLVRSLKIQAGRATRYKAILEELNAKRLALAVHRYGCLVADREAATTQVIDLTGREETARHKVQAALADCRGAEEKLERSRVAAGRMETEIATLEARAETAREKAAFSARMVAELDGKTRWYQSEIEDCRDRSAELGDARTEVADARERAAAERDAAAERVDNAETTARAARGEAQESRTAVEVASRSHFEHLAARSRLGNRLSTLAAEEKALAERGSRAAERLAGFDDDASAHAARVTTTGQEREAADEAAAAASTRVSRTEERIEVDEARAAQITETVSALDRQVSATRSRIDVLRSLEARMAGVAEGARGLLSAARDGEPGLEGVRGILADLVETDAEHANAVETALGRYATAVVVDSFETALRAVEVLTDRRLGRCVLLPLDSLRTRVPSDHQTVFSNHGTGADDVGRALLPVVRAEAGVLPAVEAVLADAVVVDDLDAFRAAAFGAASSSWGLRAVTVCGAVLDDRGGLEGGGVAGGAGIVSRNVELRELSERLESSASELDAARTELGAARSALSDLRASLGSARGDQRSAEAAAHRARAAEERARVEMAAVERERGRLRTVTQEVRAALGKVHESLVAAKGQEADAAVAVAAAEEQRGLAASMLRGAEETLRAAESTRSDARVEYAAVSERFASLDARAADVEREYTELESAAEEARVELVQCGERRKQSLERGREAHEEQAKAERRRDQCVREIVELRHQVSVAQRDLADLRLSHADLDGAASGVLRELNRFRLRQQEARVRVETLLDRIQEELGVDLHAAWQVKSETGRDETGRDESGSEDGGAGVETSGDSLSTPVYVEPPVSFDEPLFDPDEVEREVGELKVRLARMGNVNLEALDQLGDAASEADRLQTHHDDLVRSRDALLAAIKKIDLESRELFLTTFNAIRENFRTMFRKLFGGGKADLFLEEGQDVLEAGVEIVARPPGKEQRSISLLSGGERTMTAVALMFAIYMARPSPFCLLDEVDAALDEGNIDRFVHAVESFSDQSQFIIVTHNKRTMTMADTIFGVSMPERGVSRRIAVKLEDVSEDGRLRAGAA